MIELSPKLVLDPAQAVTRRFAFIGTSGSGKTFSAGRFVEQLYAAGAQVVVVDVIGNWWGLRLDADGKRKGLPIYVFGGLRGDVPLEPTGGKLVADTIVDTGCSVVLDISDLLEVEQQRFVTDFATQLLRRKRRAASPMQVVWEECQDVVPETATGKESARCITAVARLAKQGRNFGVGSSFITQRPQAVAKEVLNQSQCLFLFQTLGAQETDAITKWVGKDVPKGALDQLKTFDVGECFVWSPAWLKRFENIRFARKKTFDASATPVFGSAESSKQPEPIDLAKISVAMAETLERAKENDPAALRQEIARLRADLAKPVQGAVVTQEKSVITPQDWDVIQKLNTRLTNTLHENAELKRAHEEHVAAYREGVAGLDRSVASCQRTADELSALVRDALARTKGHTGFTPPRGPARPAPLRLDARPARADRGGGDKGSGLRKGARRMMEAVASLDPRPASRDQVALLAGMTASSGTFSTYLGDLRNAGYIVEERGAITLTPSGWSFLGGRGQRQKASTHDDLMALWSPRFRAGARAMLEHLSKVWPSSVTRPELAKAVGMEVTSGTFSTYLGDLRRQGLLSDGVDRNFVRASDDLFPS